ncbi:MAG: hypothetical protein OQK03_08280 [Colwellia sp.]|nr:hypothetical protein [Colwellia sp.]
MNSYIKKIIIFGKDNQKRELSLTNGLNIISGHSKKGKSALIEIVDYCLCATVPSIPKGVISDFAALFCIVLKVDKNFLVIARPNNNDTQSKIYVSLETDVNFLKNFDISYFENQPLLKMAALIWILPITINFSLMQMIFVLMLQISTTIELV